MALNLGQPLALAIDQAAAAMKPVLASWRALTAAVSAGSVGTTAWGTRTHYHLLNTPHLLEMSFHSTDGRSCCCFPARNLDGGGCNAGQEEGNRKQLVASSHYVCCRSRNMPSAISTHMSMESHVAKRGSVRPLHSWGYVICKRVHFNTKSLSSVGNIPHIHISCRCDSHCVSCPVQTHVKLSEAF